MRAAAVDGQVLHGQAGAYPAFARRLQDFGAAIAIVTESGETVSYLELAARADAFAANFPDEPALVALRVANTIEAVVAYLAALRAGNPVILLSESADTQRVLAAFEPNVLWGRRDDGWRLDKSGGRLRAHPDLALLLSTSGTTGAPKLVRLSAAAIQANAESIAAYLSLTPDDRAITALPLSYSYGLSVLNSHLAVGASVILTERSVTDPEFWALVDRLGATSLAGVPYTYELIERGKFLAQCHPTLLTLTQAGGRIPADAAGRLAAWAEVRGGRVFLMYGQTEATARMAYLAPEKVARKPNSIGQAIPGGAFELRDELGRRIDQPEIEGELIYRGDNVMMGYAVCRDDLARGAELTELATGDLAKRDVEGDYRITGRRSRFAKLFGLRISLDEVETKMIAVGAPGLAASNDQFLALGVGSGQGAGLIEALSAAYDLPLSAFRVSEWDDLPTLPSGKPDYPAVLARCGRPPPKSASGGAPPDRIRAAYAHAFPRKVTSDRDSFVSLAGDSLNYVGLSLEIEAVLGELPDSWEQLTIGELCAMTPTVRPTGWWRPRWIETEVVLRALAILSVVTVHASDFMIAGGAEALLLLAGYNLARYQKKRLLEGAPFAVPGSFFARVVIPYYALLLFYSLAKGKFDVPSLLLISNFSGRFATLMEPFWFLEALLQCLVVAAAMFAVPPVRRLATATPWAFGMTWFGAALVLKMAAHATYHEPSLGSRTPDVVLYLLALGWCMYEARRSVAKRIVLSAAALAITGFKAGWLQEVWPSLGGGQGLSNGLWILGCAYGLLWARRIVLPTVLHAVISAIAAASFYIYLTHVFPVHAFTVMGLADNVIAPVTASVALGLLVWRLAVWLEPILVSGLRPMPAPQAR